jgi:hypothetical protein
MARARLSGFDRLSGDVEAANEILRSVAVSILFRIRSGRLRSFGSENGRAGVLLNRGLSLDAVEATTTPATPTNNAAAKSIILCAAGVRRNSRGFISRFPFSRFPRFLLAMEIRRSKPALAGRFKCSQVFANSL